MQACTLFTICPTYSAVGIASSLPPVLPHPCLVLPPSASSRILLAHAYLVVVVVEPGLGSLVVSRIASHRIIVLSMACIYPSVCPKRSTRSRPSHTRRVSSLIFDDYAVPLPTPTLISDPHPIRSVRPPFTQCLCAAVQPPRCSTDSTSLHIADCIWRRCRRRSVSSSIHAYADRLSSLGRRARSARALATLSPSPPPATPHLLVDPPAACIARLVAYIVCIYLYWYCLRRSTYSASPPPWLMSMSLRILRAGLPWPRHPCSDARLSL